MSYTEKVEHLLEENKFEEALIVLGKKSADYDGLEFLKAEQEKDEIEQRQRECANTWIEQIETRLRSERPDFNAIRQKLDKLARDVYRDHPYLPRLRDFMNKRREEVQREQEIAEVQQKLRRMKQKIARYPKSDYQDLRDETNTLREKYPESDQVDELAQDAQALLDEAKEIHHYRTTGGQSGEFAMMIRLYKDALDAGREKIEKAYLNLEEDGSAEITVPDDKENALIIPTRDAHRELLELVQEAAHHKVEKKIEEARSQLNARPTAVYADIKKILATEGHEYDNLYQYMDDEHRHRLEVLLDQATRRKEIRTRVTHKLTEIGNIASESPRQAWEQVLEIAREDPHAPKLKDTRPDIITALQEQEGYTLDSLDAQRQDIFRDKEITVSDAMRSLDEIIDRINELLSWLEADPQQMPELQKALDKVRKKAQELREKCTDNKKAFEALQQGLAYVREGDLESAEKKIADLKKRNEDWIGTKRLEASYEAQKNIEDFIVEKRRKIHTSTSPDWKNIKRALEDQSSYPNDPRLSRFMTEIEARHTLYRAKEHHDHHEFPQARVLYQKVKRYVENQQLDDDILQQASQGLQDLQADEKEQRAVSQAIQKAEEAISPDKTFEYYYDAEKCYRDVLTTLESHTETKDKRWETVCDLTQEVRQAWEARTGQALEEYLERSSPPAKEIIRLVTEVLVQDVKVDPRRWQGKALPPAYRILAEKDLKRGEYEAAQQAVNQALRYLDYDQENSHPRELRNELEALELDILRENLYQKMNESENPKEKDQLLSDFLEKHPLDIEVRLRLIDRYLQAEPPNIAYAWIHLDRLERQLAKNPTVREKWESFFQLFRQWATVEQNIHNKKLEIAQWVGIPGHVMLEGEGKVPASVCQRRPRYLKKAVPLYEEMSQEAYEGWQRVVTDPTNNAAFIWLSDQDKMMRRHQKLKAWYTYWRDGIKSRLHQAFDSQQQDRLHKLSRDLTACLQADPQKEISKLVADRWLLARRLAQFEPDDEKVRSIKQEAQDLWEAFTIKKDEVIADNRGPATTLKNESIKPGRSLSEHLALLERLRDVLVMAFRTYYVIHQSSLPDASSQFQPPDHTMINNIRKEIEQCIRKWKTVEADLQEIQTELERLKKPLIQDITETWRDEVEEKVKHETLKNESEYVYYLEEARGINSPKYQGFWSRLDTLWDKLSDNDQIKHHRTVEFWCGRLDKEKARYQRLLEAVGALIIHIRHEEFEKAQQAIDRIENEPSNDELLDLDISQRLEISGFGSALPRLSLSDLKTALEQRRRQIEALEEMLAIPVVDWQRRQAEIKMFVAEGKYQEALQVCHSAVGGFAMDKYTHLATDLEPTLALKPAQHKFETFIDQQLDEPLSEKASELGGEMSKRLSTIRQACRAAEELCSVGSEDGQSHAFTPQELKEWLIDQGCDQELVDALPEIPTQEGLPEQWRLFDLRVEQMRQSIENLEHTYRARPWPLRHSSPQERQRRYLLSQLEEWQETGASKAPVWQDLQQRLEGEV